MSLYLAMLSSLLPGCSHLCVASQLNRSLPPGTPRRRRRKNGAPTQFHLYRYHYSQNPELPRSYEIAMLVWRLVCAWRQDPIHEMVLRMREFTRLETKVAPFDTPAENNFSFPVTPEAKIQEHGRAPNWAAVAQQSPRPFPRASRAAARSLEPIPIVHPKDLNPVKGWIWGPRRDRNAHATKQLDATTAMYIQVLQPYYGVPGRRVTVSMDAALAPRAAEENQPTLDPQGPEGPHRSAALPKNEGSAPNALHWRDIPNAPRNVVWLPVPALDENPSRQEARALQLRGGTVDRGRPYPSGAVSGALGLINRVDGGVEPHHSQQPDGTRYTTAGQTAPSCASEDSPREIRTSQVQVDTEASPADAVFYPPPRTPTVLRRPVIPYAPRQVTRLPSVPGEDLSLRHGHAHGVQGDAASDPRGRRCRSSNAASSYGSTSSVKVHVAQMPTPPQHPEGTRYHIVGQIGQGGFARVLAAATSAGELVALKVMHKPKTARHDDISRAFNTERDLMSLTTQSEKKFLLHLEAAWEQEDFLYLAMPLCAEDLRGAIKRATANGALHTIPEKEKKLLCAEMVLALIDLQKLQTIHGDIKPENFLITKIGRVVLSDFGLAQRPQPHERHPSFNFADWNAPQTFGTPGYFSPEALCRLRRRCSLPLTSQADVFSLGLVLAELFWELPSPLWSSMSLGVPEPPGVNAGESQWIPLERQAAHMMTDGLSRLHDDRALEDKRVKDLVFGMLHADPKQRPRPYQILEHPYLADLDMAAVYEGRIPHASQPHFFESLQPGTFSQFILSTSYGECDEFSNRPISGDNTIPSESRSMRPPNNEAS
ncbi:kinase-like protein [Trametes coccinea BRFM310]|uniref:non-specific serine/threonine protein kinase n=1 Tax=Trametes coccinea (strain BRFM310) TaxID=1353009 RepID=A0A1Y2INF8_TRAC3|nr:kinase-like protein [Trametes coccinea BRFM310]